MHRHGKIGTAKITIDAKDDALSGQLEGELLELDLSLETEGVPPKEKGWKHIQHTGEETFTLVMEDVTRKARPEDIPEMTDWPMMSLFQRLRILWWALIGAEAWDSLLRGVAEGRTLRSAYQNAIQS